MNDEKPINRSSENLLSTEPLRTPTKYNHTFPSFLEHASFHLSGVSGTVSAGHVARSKDSGQRIAILRAENTP